MYSISIKFIQRSIQRRYQSCRYAILLYLFWIVKHLHQSYFCFFVTTTLNQNHKKVLLRERKRHTARRVSSTPPAVLSGGGAPYPWLGGGGVPHPWPGYSHPDLAGEGTPSLAGVLPCPNLPGGGGASSLAAGIPPPHLDPARVPPPILTWSGGAPSLARVPPIWTWLGYPPPPERTHRTS